MPFDPRGLSPLANTDSFTLWLYTTADLRAAVLAGGYFNSAAERLQPGHVVVVQAADSLSFLPVRSSAGVGNGLVLDASAPPLRLNAYATVGFEFALGPVVAETRSVALGAVPNGLYVGRSFSVGATTGGAVTSLSFTMLDAGGGVIAGPVIVAVASGSASASFAAPAAGSGYRIRVQDVNEPLVTQTSPSFVVTTSAALLTEAGGSLLGAEGGELLL